MEPTGVRMACPQCTLDVVMHAEGECPLPVTKVVEGVPWCPNCDVPMTPEEFVHRINDPGFVGMRHGAFAPPKTGESEPKGCHAKKNDQNQNPLFLMKTHGSGRSWRMPTLILSKVTSRTNTRII